MSLKLEEKIILKSSKFKITQCQKQTKERSDKEISLFLSFGILSIVADSSFLKVIEQKRYFCFI